MFAFIRYDIDKVRKTLGITTITNRVTMVDMSGPALIRVPLSKYQWSDDYFGITERILNSKYSMLEDFIVDNNPEYTPETIPKLEFIAN